MSSNDKHDLLNEIYINSHPNFRSGIHLKEKHLYTRMSPLVTRIGGVRSYPPENNSRSTGHAIRNLIRFGLEHASVVPLL